MKVEFAPGVDKDIAKLGLGGPYKMKWYEEYFLWPLEKLWKFPGERWEDVVAFVQRGIRGYATRDCWSVDWYLARVIPDMLEEMISTKNGGGNSYPGWGKGGKTSKEWHKTVREMIKGFRAHYKLKDEMIAYDSKPGKKLDAQHKHGMKLFAQWFGHLWD